MTLPNPASDGLHEALGFEPVGTYRGSARSSTRWHDVAWAQLVLAHGDDTPAEPV